MRHVISISLLLAILSCGKDNGTNTAVVCCEIKIEINGGHDDGHVEISPDGLIHEKGTLISVEAFPDSNMAFYEWEGDISSFQNPYTFIIDKNVSIIAKFGVDQHWVSTSIVGNGTITKRILNTDLEQPEDTDSYRHGTNLELTAVPEDGWRFKGWQIYHHYDSDLFVKEENPLEYLIRTRENILANFELNQNKGRFEVFRRKAGLNDYAESIIELRTGDYIVTGMVGQARQYGLFSSNIRYGSAFVAKHNQDLSREWITFIGNKQRDFKGKSIIEISDGNLVLTGDLSESSQIDIVMISANGSKKWLKSYGGDNTDYSNDITETEEGFILTGAYSSTHPDFNGEQRGEYDIFIMKTDKEGNKQWVKSYGGSNSEFGKSIVKTDDGYLIGGHSNSSDGDFVGSSKGNNDILLFKLDLNGELKWFKTIGGSLGDILHSMTETIDKNIVITGFTESNDGDFSGMNKGEEDIFVFKLDSNGNVIWKRTFGGSLNDRGTSVTEKLDGSIAITGYSESKDEEFSNLNRNAEDIVLIELDPSGGTKSITTFGGNSSDYGKSVVALSNGNYVLAGHSYSNNGDFMTDDIVGSALDYFILKWH